MIIHVDYDLATYGFAAMDLGCILNMRLLDLSKDDFDSRLSFPSDGDIKQFLTAYLDESQLIGSMSRAHTLDQLFQETLLGSMMSMTAMREYCCQDEDMLLKEMRFTLTFAKWKQVYHDLKARLAKQDLSDNNGYQRC